MFSPSIGSCHDILGPSAWLHTEQILLQTWKKLHLPFTTQNSTCIVISEEEDNISEQRWIFRDTRHLIGCISWNTTWQQDTSKWRTSHIHNYGQRPSWVRWNSWYCRWPTHVSQEKILCGSTFPKNWRSFCHLLVIHSYSPQTQIVEI